MRARAHERAGEAISVSLQFVGWRAYVLCVCVVYLVRLCAFCG